MGLRSLLLFLLLLALPASAERLILLHTNDLHGYLEATEKGGLSRVATLVRSLRAAFPGEVLLLDAGDLAQGTPLSGLFYGEPVARTLDLLDYDAVAIGNHEFDWGGEKMRAMLAAINEPVVCANLVTEDGTRPYPAYEIVDCKGLKVAVVGLVTPDTPNVSSPGGTRGYRFLDPVTSLQELMPELDEKSDLVIALTHLGVEEDKKLARAVPQLDLIVGGHSHTALEKPLTEAGVPILQAGSYARFLGFALLEIEADRIASLEYRLLPIGPDMAADPAVVELLAPFVADVTDRMEQPVGELLGGVSKVQTPGYVDNPLGNLIADVFRAETGADVALYNRGGIRVEQLQEGVVTRGDLYQLLPFDDPIVVLKASGSQLEAILRQGVEGPARISAAGVTRQEAFLVEGEPIVPDRTYRIAVTDFLANGGDQMPLLAGLEVEQRLDFGRDLFARHLERVGQLLPPLQGRLRQ